MVRDYETMFILKPDLDEESRNAVLERIKGIITKEGELVEVDEWGNRKLAYEIKKYNTGYYIVIDFKGEASLVSELERNFRIIDGVLRYMVIKQEK